MTKEGDFMTQKDLVIEIMKLNNGILKSSEAKKSGIDYKTLQRMSLSGEIEKLRQGLYMDPNQIEDEYFSTQYICKKCIFSHETALYFHDLTDRTPLQMMLTIPSGYNTRLIKEKEKYKFFYISKELYPLGAITIKSPFGNSIQVYNKERSLCDCLKKKDQLDLDLVLDAVKRYMKTPGNDYSKLLQYSEVFKIQDLVRKYMEMLI